MSWRFGHDLSRYSRLSQYQNYKVVYRRYAGLFFCMGVDPGDNELAHLEAIHLLVEVLDAFFGNVCELDILFNFYRVRKVFKIDLFSKVYPILDEMFLAGEIQETSKTAILARLDYLDHLE